MKSLTETLRSVSRLNHVSDAAGSQIHQRASLGLSPYISGLVAAAFWVATGTGLGAGYAGWAVGEDANNNGIIIHTTDSGATWQQQGAGMFSGAALLDVFALDRSTAYAVGEVANGFSSIYRTTDAGLSWNRIGSSADLPNAVLYKISMPDAQNIWAVGPGTIVHSGDGGASWINQTPAGYSSTPLQGVSSPDGLNVWATGLAKDGYATALKSTDAGLTWTRQSNGLDPDADHLLGIAALDGNTAWAVGGPDGAVFKTTNGGEKWDFVVSAEPGHDANELKIVNTDTIWVACDSTIDWTFDGGSTWNSYNTADYTMQISVADQTNVWAISEGISTHLFHTGDGGLNWEEQTLPGGVPLRNLHSVSFASEAVPEPAGLALMVVVAGACAGFFVRRVRAKN